MPRTTKRIALGVLFVVATAFATLLTLNLSLGSKEIDKPLLKLYSVHSPEFEWVMGATLTPPFAAGNQVRALVNGDEIFPAMLSAIRSAQKVITLESYIYWSGAVGKDFSDALTERSRQGVRIKVLLDWFGSQLNEELLEEMRASGIDIQRYNPPHWHNLNQMNHRTHRRLMVVDGKIGFIGGAGLADKWSGNAQDPQQWRDTHFQVEGPVVTQMQSAFIDNWIDSTGEVLHSLDYLPQVATAGTASAQLFSSSPGGGSRSVQLMYLLAITSATTSIDLSAAYFVPDEVTYRSLVQALQRGVRLRIIMPGPFMDNGVVRRASRAKWGDLLEAGAELYEYQPTMFHCKVMVVDGLWVSVGSTNFDLRSFSINDEANLNVYDAAFAIEQTAIFEMDLKQSRRVTLQEWKDRPWWTRSLDAAATLLDSQL
jgi:cardiolipin synthase